MWNALDFVNVRFVGAAKFTGLKIPEHYSADSFPRQASKKRTPDTAPEHGSAQLEEGEEPDGPSPKVQIHEGYEGHGWTDAAPHGGADAVVSPLAGLSALDILRLNSGWSSPGPMAALTPVATPVAITRPAGLHGTAAPPAARKYDTISSTSFSLTCLWSTSWSVGVASIPWFVPNSVLARARMAIHVR